jgi:outer membrane lipoprotein-sorting protein
VLLSLLSSSCAGKQAVRPVEAPRVFEGPVTINVLRDSVFFENIRTLKSEVEITVMRGGEKVGKFGGVFAYSYPDAMLLRVFDPFGLTAVEMVISGQSMQVFIPQSDSIYEGGIPSIGPPRGSLFGMEEGRSGYTLYAFRQAGEELELLRKYSFNPSLENTGVYVYGGGRLFIGMAMSDYRNSTPSTVKLSFFNGFTAEMTLEEPELNEDISPEHFMPVDPNGRRVFPLDMLYRQGR